MKLDDSDAWKILLRELEDHTLIKAAVTQAKDRRLEPVPGFMRLEFAREHLMYRDILEKNLTLVQKILCKCFGKEFRIVLVRPMPLQLSK